jgi:hypothetical protein
MIEFQFFKKDQNMKFIFFPFCFYMLFIALGCSGCGGVKKEPIVSPKAGISITQNNHVLKEGHQKNKSNFRLSSEESKFTIVFPNGLEVKTDDYNPILSQIPENAIKFDFGDNGYGNKVFNYHHAIIDFTKIDRKTKLKLTANMHFEFPTDVDSLLYADYRFDFPSDTTIVLPDNPELREQLTIYARCWKGCHKGEYSMEIQIGSIGNLSRFDKQGNKLAEFYSDRFGYGDFSNDSKYYGGAVGGYYSDGGGFYRKTRVYIYDIKSKEIVFHKLIDFGKDVQFFYETNFDKWSFNLDDESDIRNFIDIKRKLVFSMNKEKFKANTWVKSDLNGYFFQDGSSALFERDFEKIPLHNIASPYPSPVK